MFEKDGGRVIIAIGVDEVVKWEGVEFLVKISLGRINFGAERQVFVQEKLGKGRSGRFRIGAE